MDQTRRRRRSPGHRPAPRRDPAGGVRVKEFREPGQQSGSRPQGECAGVLEMNSQGWGLLRTSANWGEDPRDAFVPAELVRKLSLRPGQQIAARTRPPNGSQRRPSAVEVETVEGLPIEDARRLPTFDRLTAESPTKRLRLEHPGGSPSGRIIDLLSPLGKGQRGLIIAPPFAGKTRLLSDIAAGIAATYPEVVIFLLLVDERPEEVTGFRKAGIGQVIASSYDTSPDRQLRQAELAMERAQRLVEAGKDVAILLDSLTRLTRASNLSSNGSGRTLSGGLDPAAVRFPRKLFGAARDTQEAGSLTIIATVLVETESRLDDLIYQEFKGTGNWELRLDRSLTELRLFPSIDIPRSGTRHEELLYTPEELESVQRLRRALHAHGSDAAGQLKLMLGWLNQMSTNEALVKAAARMAARTL
jgi:transcription termination factor Rho